MHWLALMMMFSPHAWGWTDRGLVGVGYLSVFPTRVGVDRPGPRPPKPDPCFPHTRGGGP